MKYAKLMREVFRANARTEAYLETSAYWQHCFAEMTFLYLRPLARHWGLPMEAVKDEVFNTHNGDVRWTLLFTQTITSTWGVEEATLLSGYLETRAWREGSVGRRYLNALAQSSFGRLEVVRSRSGVAYSVRAYGSNDDPISIPHRFSGDSPPVGACLAGRVISMQGRHQMSTVSMTLNQRLAGQLHAASIELQVIVKTLLDKCRFTNTRYATLLLTIAGQIASSPWKNCAWRSAAASCNHGFLRMDSSTALPQIRVTTPARSLRFD